MPICKTGGRVVHSWKLSRKWAVPMNSRKSPTDEIKAAVANHSLKIWMKAFMSPFSSLLDHEAQ